MRNILISIKPEEVARILSGEQTIEIRKTTPKCELPITVYIYCTKTGVSVEKDCGLGFPESINGKIVASFTLRKVEELKRQADVYEPNALLTASIQTRYRMFNKSCLLMEEIWEYTKGKGYVWHIDDLKIFDRPLELVNFGLKYAPQSWRYMEEEE